MFKLIKKSLLSLILGLDLSSAHAGVYFQNYQSSATGATNFADGSQLFSLHLGAGGQVTGTTYRELQLTGTSTSNTRAALLLPDLDPGTNIFAFSAKWNAFIYGNFPNASEGLSFNFGNLSGTDLISTSYSQEDGYGNGLSLGVRTSSTNNPGFYLRVNGTVIASLAYDSVTQWGTLNSKSHHFEMDWRLTNGVTVRVDGVTIFTNVAVTNFTPQSGNRFALAARCSANTEIVRLDDIFIATGGNLKKIPTTAPYYKSSEYTSAGQTADKAFDGDKNTKWLTLANTGYVGASVASAPRTAVIYTLTSAEDVPGRDPASWHFESTTNGGTNWLRHSSVDVAGFFSRGETHSFMVTNSAPANACRILITTNQGAAEIQLAEMNFYELESVTPPSPLATTQPALNLSETGARLNGIVNPNFSATTAWFEWGATTNYGNSTAPQNVGSGGAGIAFSATITNLIVDSTYHFRAVAQNVSGTNYGADVSFIAQSTFERVPFDLSATAGYGDCAWADYNNDGFMDLASTRSSPPSGTLWRNQNGTNFVLAFDFYFVDGGSLDWGDYDGDGFVDLLVTSSGYTTVVLYHNLGGTNFSGVDIPESDGARSATWVDFDNDGDLDFLLTSYGGGSLYRNDGGHQFHRLVLPEVVGGHIPGAAWGDYDNDGDLDLFYGTAYLGIGGYRELLRNDGRGKFARVPVGISTYGRTRATWGDYNNDGYLDLTLASDGTGPVWRNNGGTNFTQQSAPGIGFGGAANAPWGDFNNDGKPDYILTGSTGSELATQLWRNEGGDNFANVMPELVGYAGGGTRWADIDNDGRLDFVISAQVWRNNAVTSNAPPSAPGGGLSVSPTSIRLNFSWKPATDDTTPQAGLTYNIRIGTTPGGTDIVSPNSGSDGQRRIAAMGNMQTGTNAWFDLPAGTYYWAVQAVDQGFKGGPFSAEHSFSYTGFGPSIVTKDAVTIVRSAKLNADVAGGGLPTSVWFEYGLNTAYGLSTPVISGGNKLTPGAVSCNTTNLIPGATYHYRAVAQNDEGIVYGQGGIL